MIILYIDLIIGPGLHKVIDMINEQPITWTAIVPAFLPTILQQIVFVIVTRVTYQIGIAPLTHGFHARNRGGSSQFLGLLPTQIHLLHSREINRTPAFASIVATIHQVPLIHCREGGGRRQRIDIGQTQRMTEFMDKNADATHAAIFPQLARDRSITGIDATRHQTCDRTCIRPDIT